MLLYNSGMRDGQKPQSGYYKQSVPTALHVAYERTLTDIPFSQEIFTEIIKIHKNERENLFKELRFFELAPRFEARYKLINKLLKQSGIKQVLEIASGFSPRGIEIAQNHEFKYVEMDLPENAAAKRKITDKIITKHKIETGNLFIGEGDGLNFKDLNKVISNLDETQPVAVITEGLLRYLNFKEKTLLSRNIHKLLEKFSGIWIASDTILRSDSQSWYSLSKQSLNNKYAHTELNLFKSSKEFKDFFQENGFSVENHKITEIKKLSSLKKLEITEDRANKIFTGRYVCVMRNV